MLCMKNWGDVFAIKIYGCSVIMSDEGLAKAFILEKA